MLKYLVPFICIAFFSATEVAYASKLYRCEGKVQYRPCSMELQSGASRGDMASIVSGMHLHRVRRQVPQPSDARIARILQSSFHRLRGGQGLWKGYVAGKGMVHLTLNIFRNGSLVSQRYMGPVKLKPSDKRVSFRFQSTPPTGGNWSWKILASPSFTS